MSEQFICAFPSVGIRITGGAFFASSYERVSAKRKQKAYLQYLRKQIRIFLYTYLFSHFVARKLEFALENA
jgi:hypothetical protein